MTIRDFGFAVSTHSRLKAAERPPEISDGLCNVSTHSRLKAADP